MKNSTPVILLLAAAGAMQKVEMGATFFLCVWPQDAQLKLWLHLRKQQLWTKTKMKTHWKTQSSVGYWGIQELQVKSKELKGFLTNCPGCVWMQFTLKSQMRLSKSMLSIQLPNYHINCILFCYRLGGKKYSPRNVQNSAYKHKFSGLKCDWHDRHIINKLYQHVRAHTHTYTQRL